MRKVYFSLCVVLAELIRVNCARWVNRSQCALLSVCVSVCLTVLQPEVFVDQQWRSKKSCLKTFPRHLLVLRKRTVEQVLLFAHASLEVLPDPQYLKVSLTFFLFLLERWLSQS